jgi:hypothetical protein
MVLMLPPVCLFYFLFVATVRSCLCDGLPADAQFLFRISSMLIQVKGRMVSLDRNHRIREFADDLLLLSRRKISSINFTCIKGMIGSSIQVSMDGPSLSAA